MEAAMSKSVAPRYCPACDEIVFALRSPDEDPAIPLSCPKCRKTTQAVALNFDFPIGPILALRLLGALAQILKKTGVVEQLQEKAKTTETPLDDFALRIAAAIINEASTL
jgi:hypothetical protein